MKKARLILSASMLSIAAFSAVTFSSCSKDEEICLVGYAGDDCKTEVRKDYFNTYRGTGNDSDGGTYTDWGMVFTTLGTDVTNMKLAMVDNNDITRMSFNVKLNTNTTFTVEEKVDGTSTWTGQGTVNSTNASVTLIEKDASGTPVQTYTFTFANMIKE